MDISKYRQELRNLFIRQMKMLWIFLETRAIIKGGIYKTRLKCGKKGCRCEKGKLHEVWMFYRSEEGKTKIRTMNEEYVSVYGQYIRNYQRYRQTRAELVKIHKEQIRLINLIEDGLNEENRNIEQKFLKKGR